MVPSMKSAWKEPDEPVRVLSLDVKQPSSVTDVMVIAKERRTL